MAVFHGEEELQIAIHPQLPVEIESEFNWVVLFFLAWSTVNRLFVCSTHSCYCRFAIFIFGRAFLITSQTHSRFFVSHNCMLHFCCFFFKNTLPMYFFRDPLDCGFCCGFFVRETQFLRWSNRVPVYEKLISLSGHYI